MSKWVRPDEGEVVINVAGLPVGLYEVYWVSGGSSEAAIGMNSDGSHWIAPTNWVSPAAKVDWSAVDKVVRLFAHEDKPREASA